MNLLHFRYRDRLGLLAADVLDPQETDAMSKHVSTCRPCQAELSELRLVSVALEDDAVMDRPFPISSDALRTRVLAQIRSASPHSVKQPVWSLRPIAMALSLIGVGLLTGVLVTRMSSAPAQVEPAQIAQASADSAAADSAANDAAFYERLQKTHARANAVRYLSEAQDVLMQVASAADCPNSGKESVDVTREAQTSRLLLKRRAALVSGTEDSLIAARGVMEEVEGVLQQVAEFEQCTRRTEVDAIALRMDRRKLLMKIDLVTQELAAP
ncbi:MAG: hypothetical protein ABIR28_10195 [Vicinamibacteria bacterium]